MAQTATGVEAETAPAELARSRHGCYALFSTVFARPPDRDFLTRLLSSEAGALLDGPGLSSVSDVALTDEVLEALAVEYTSLFVGPGPRAALYESLWRDGSGQLWGESAARVKRFIEHSGLHSRPERTMVPDHVSVELEFMGRLCGHEAGLWGAVERLDDLRMCLETEAAFLSEHLLEWVPALCDRVVRATDGYYGRMARLTREFLESDVEHVRRAALKAGGQVAAGFA